ncbi:uncharacterized protein LOC144509893 isoform X2 [Mustelus asterias]
MSSGSLLYLVPVLSLSLAATLPRIAESLKVHLPYKSNSSTCLNTTTEYFNSRMGMCCSKCPPGMKMTVYCTANVDSVCEGCGSNQYTEHWNRLKKCIACVAPCDKDQEMILNCTVSTKRICQCHEGLHCIDSTKDTCNHCRRNTACQEGQGVIEQGTKQSDVKCAPCAAGTFSNTVSSTEPCHPHTDCALLWRKTLQNGTSTRDAICSKELTLHPPVRETSSTPRPSSPALTQVTHTTKTEPGNVIARSITQIPDDTAPSRNPSPEGSQIIFWITVVCVPSIVVIILAFVTLMCVRHNIRGKKSELWDQNANVPKKMDDPVETVRLISVPESALEAVSSQNGVCEQNNGVTGSQAECPCSPSRSNSSGSGGVRQKPGPGFSSKEEEQTQTHVALTHLNNYSRIDSQEDQGYISRESRPSSGAPSPVMEFNGNPTVSVTINTGKCYVNCCHRQGGGAPGPVSAEEDFPTPEEEGTEVDEGFPIQEEQQASEPEKWKEAGVSVEAESECHWRQYNSVPHQEDGEELQLPVQDTSGNIY